MPRSFKYYLLLFVFISCLLPCGFTQENTAIRCGDGIDNDGDGLIDCDDQDCYDLQNDGCRTCFDDGLSFADIVIEYAPNCANILQPNNPDKAIGVSDHSPSSPQFNFVSLGQGGYIKLGFTNNLIVNSGTNDADIWVFEIGIAVEGTQVELEPFDMFTRDALISAGITDSDGDGYFEFGAISGSTASVDIDATLSGFAAGNLKFKAIKLTDIPDQGCSGITAGADIDAVCALSSIPLEICGNQIDDDVDGLVDCDDPDIAMECCCLTTKVLDLGANISVCAGDTVEIAAGEVFNSYLWSDNSSNSTLRVFTTGTYGLTVTEENNCELTDEVQVFFLPDARIIKNANKCPDSDITVDGIIFNSAGTYFDTIVDVQFSCDTIIEYRIQDVQINSQFLGADITACGQELTIESIWAQTTWPNNSTAPQFVVNTSNEIIASAIDTNGCSATDTINIELINFGAFYMPDAFSPNNDGINDQLKPEFPQNQMPPYNLIIFNHRHFFEILSLGLHVKTSIFFLARPLNLNCFF